MNTARPELATARLRLRQFRPDDAAALVELYADPEVTRHLWDGRARTEIEVRQMLDRLEATWRERGFGTWAITERDGDGRAIGRCGLSLMPETGEIEVGYHLGRPWWGRGYATEAASAVLVYALGTLRLERVVSTTRPENAASQAVMQRIGLTYAGRAIHFGRDAVVYAMTRDEFERAKSPSPGGRERGLG